MAEQPDKYGYPGEGASEADARGTTAASAEAELDAERETLRAAEELVRVRLEEAEAKASNIAEELADLADAAADHQQLGVVCDALDALVDRGAAALFWGELGATGEPREQLAAARTRIESFERRRTEVEARYQAALEELGGHRADLDDLTFDLHDVEQRRESLQQEWVVERDETALPARPIAMPWMRGFDDDRRFRNTLGGAMAAALLLGLIIPLIDIPLPETDEVIEVPERFARFIREERQPPLAVREPPPRTEPEPEPEPEVEPELEEVTELPEETQVAEVETPPAPEPSARERVASKGILAFRENFSSLSSSRPSAKLGAEASLSSEGAAEVGLPQRAMVAAQGSESSGGINLASISRDVGGGGVALSEGVELARVASAIDGGGPHDRPRSAGASSGRTDEEIQIVFDRYKAALYRLYNRALRQDPTLRGQIVLKLTIEPDGSVSLCHVQKSDMGAPDLAQQVVASVTGFDFGAKDVPPVTILYPIDFLPTA